MTSPCVMSCVWPNLTFLVDTQVLFGKKPFTSLCVYEVDQVLISGCAKFSVGGS